MVGTGGEVLLRPGAHRLLVAPGDEGVDEPVAAAAGELLLAEAEAEEVGAVVLRPEVRLEVAAGDVARPSRSPPPRIARARRVCSIGTRYGCAPCVRSRASSSIRGASAPTRRGTGSGGAGGR